MIKAIIIFGILAAIFMWLLLMLGHERDPKEDEEQARYLKEWRKRCSGKGEEKA